jgi:hypothetical protein
LRVAVDLQRGEFTFTNGNQLRRNWESTRLQRISPWSVAEIKPEYIQILCPDGTKLIAVFHSDLQRISVNGNQNLAAMKEQTMPTKKPVPPPKKGKFKPTEKPVEAPVGSEPAPVAAPKSKAVKPPKVEKPKGNYKWLLHRLKNQILDAVTNDANRGVIRDGLKSIENGRDVKNFLVRSGVSEEQIDVFLWETFVEATINRPVTA